MMFGLISEILQIYGIPLVFFIWIVLGFITGNDLEQKRKITQRQLKISVGFILISSPIALFIGGMATDAPTSTMVQFWEGFFFVEAFPLLCLLLTLVKGKIQNNKILKGADNKSLEKRH